MILTYKDKKYLFYFADSKNTAYIARVENSKPGKCHKIKYSKKITVKNFLDFIDRHI